MKCGGCLRENWRWLIAAITATQPCWQQLMRYRRSIFTDRCTGRSHDESFSYFDWPPIFPPAQEEGHSFRVWMKMHEINNFGDEIPLKLVAFPSALAVGCVKPSACYMVGLHIITVSMRMLEWMLLSTFSQVATRLKYNCQVLLLYFFFFFFTVYFHSTTFLSQTLYFLLHYIYLKSTLIS